MFWIDEDDATYNSTYKTSAKGKIVGLKQEKQKWGPVGTLETAIDIDSTTDGATATKNLINAYKADLSNFATTYPAFYWVYTTVNGSDIDGRWYIPAKDELKALCVAWNGGTTPANDTARGAFNASLIAASGAKIEASPYWSSTQNNVYNNVWCVSFSICNLTSESKSTSHRVRVVSAF